MRKYIESLIYKITDFFFPKLEPLKQETVDIEKVKIIQKYYLLKTPKSNIKKKREKRKRLPNCPVLFKTSYNEEVCKKEALRLSGSAIKLRAYKCEHCPAWHLTHKRKNDNR